MPRGKKGSGAAAAAAPAADETPKQEPTEQVVRKGDQQYVPGAAPQVIQELVDKALEVADDKDSHAELTKRLAAHKPEMVRLSKKYKEYFEEDPNSPGTWWYRAGGVKIKYVHSEDDEAVVSRDSKTVNVEDY